MLSGSVHGARMRLLREVAERGRQTYSLLPAAHSGWREAAEVIHREVAERLAPQHGLSPGAWKRAVALWVAAQVQNVEVRVRMRPSGFEQFVLDDRYVTEFERPGTSGGAKHRAIRTLVEHTVLGVPPDCAPADRPVYGYLSGSNESSLQQYGPVVLHLRPSVVRRSTFAGADSLDYATHLLFADPSFAPAPILRPRVSALPAHDIFIATHFPLRYDKRDVDPLVCHGFGDLTSYGYAEAQIYGGLRVADVGAVTITMNAAIRPQVLARLDECRITWIMTPGDRP